MQQAPQQGGNRFMNAISQNPEVLLALGAGLLGGRTGPEQWSGGLSGMAQTMGAAKEKKEEKAKKNATLEWLRQNAPEYADAVDQGVLTAGDAYKMKLEAQKPVKPNFINAGDGQLFNENTGEWISAPGGSSKTDRYGLPNSGAISQKVRALEAQGMSPDIALGVASGRYNISVNPQTGERVIVDIATQKIIPLGQDGQAPPPYSSAEPAAEAEPTLYEMADDATGVVPSIKRGMSDTIGQIPGPVGRAGTFPDEVKAGASFDLFKRDLIRSLSLNPRFPVAEQQRIENLVPRGVTTAGGTLKSSLEELDRELRRIERQAAEGANNPSLHIEQRRADRQTLQAVRAARARIGVPQSGMQPTQDGNADDPLGLR
tara:strand:- start:611 stop:1729 length:1119 start_codon:yes stop_codon:yes gene_type:complete